MAQAAQPGTRRPNADPRCTCMLVPPRAASLTRQHAPAGPRRIHPVACHVSVRSGRQRHLGRALTIPVSERLSRPTPPAVILAAGAVRRRATRPADAAGREALL